MTSRLQPLEKPLAVTRPLLPPLEAYHDQLAEIWQSQQLTNFGAFHRRLEAALAQRSGHGRGTLWKNGTTALIAMLQAARATNDVVVTPFTFPATVHAITALGLNPVFADVDPETLTLSPDAVAEAITPTTSAVLGTHIYGTACDAEALGKVARAHGAKLLFDGAHSFAVPAPAFTSDAALGDATMLSFHATKLFHTVEGGAVLTPDPGIHERLQAVRNFGIESEDVVGGFGVNGKMSELHAALGLLTLDMLDAEIERRREVAGLYLERLDGVEGVRVISGKGESMQYFVVRINAKAFGASRDAVHARMRRHNVLSRKYFYPLCSDIGIYADRPSAHNLPEARRAADEVLALPFYGGLTAELVNYVCDVLLGGE